MTRSRRSAPRAGRRRARRRGVATRRSPRSSRRRIPSATSRCTSPSSRWSPRPSASRRAAGGRSPRRSPPSSRRAYDFIRMAAISRATICLCGSHAGVSIGEDGPSQMALEDIAMMRAVHGSTVLHPCDANQTAKLVAAMADLRDLVPPHATAGDAGALRAGREFESAAAACCARLTLTRSRSSPPASPSTRR